jgi:hypothetical protein
MLKAKSKQPKVVLVAPSGRAEGPGESAPTSPEAQKAAAQEQERKVAATLEDKLASETVDPVWSRKRSQDLRNAVGTQDPRSVVSSVACASTLCKLVLNHDTLAAQREIAAKLVELEPFHAGVVFSYDKAATPPKTTLYVMREQHDFGEIFPDQ